MLVLERQPRRLELGLRFIDVRSSAERRAGDRHRHIPKPDARRALAGEADAADQLAVVVDGVVVGGDPGKGRRDI